MKIELDDNELSRAVQALNHCARECDDLAEKAEDKASRGESDGLVHDYGPVAGAFRESAQRYTALAQRLEAMWEASDD